MGAPRADRERQARVGARWCDRVGITPAIMRAAVRAEFRRALHRPDQTPSEVVGHRLLLTAC